VGSHNSKCFVILFAYLQSGREAYISSLRHEKDRAFDKGVAFNNKTLIVARLVVFLAITYAVEM
jgi:hypothetical protein